MVNENFPIIGSIGTMTYLKPIGLIGKLFRFIARTQRKTYKEQYFLYDVRAFELGLYFDDKGRCWFKRGIVWFETFSLLEILSFFNDRGDCYVKIYLEETKKDSKANNIKFIEDRFISICTTMEKLYPDIKFIGGERRYDLKRLYTFKYEKEHRSPITNWTNKFLFFASETETSIFNNCLRIYWPWLYAKFNNKKTFREYLKDRKDVDMFLVNFVDIR